jgi:hypothetical protein
VSALRDRGLQVIDERIAAVQLVPIQPDLNLLEAEIVAESTGHFLVLRRVINEHFHVSGYHTQSKFEIVLTVAL